MSEWGGNDRGPALLGVTWAFFAVSVVTTAFRLLSRMTFSKTAGLDDGLIVLALLVNLTYAISINVAVSKGYGKHTRDLDPTTLPDLAHAVVIMGSIGVWTYSLPKLGIVALLRRLLAPSKMTQAALWFLSLSCTFVSMLLSIFWIVQCTPHAHQWNPVEVPGTCWNPSVVRNVSFVSIAYSAFLDVAFAVYPTWVIMRLQMRLRRRILISLALSGGLIGAACAIYKATLVVPDTASAAGLIDPTFLTVPILLFTMVEASLLIIIANLPTLGPFLNYIGETYSKLYSRASGIRMERLPLRQPPGKQFDDSESPERKVLHDPLDHSGLGHSQTSADGNSRLGKGSRGLRDAEIHKTVSVSTERSAV